MFVGRSSARRLGLLALLGTVPLSLGACGLLIGLEDHQAFPRADAGADADDQPDTAPDALADVVSDALPDVTNDGCAGTDCGGVCVETQTDPLNCGACGVKCGKGFKCEAGVCGNHIDQISAGANHGCELLHDGTIWCWGADSTGQLGIPASDDFTCMTGAICHPAPIQVQGLPMNTRMIQVSAGVNFTCAVAEGGTVWCWGANDKFQLGRQTSPGSPSSDVDRTPLPVPGLAAVAQVSAGYQYACARLADSSKIYCWGSNTLGTLGNGQAVNTVSGFPPGDVVLMPDGVIDVATGLGDHACALTAAHKVWCWGANGYGQLGHASITDPSMCPATKCNSTPAMIAGLDVPGDRITVSALGACARTSGGFVCWGSNTSGELGVSPEAVEHFAPQQVLLGADTIPGSDRGSYAARCVATTSGVSCFGDDSYGELGRGALSKGPCAGGGFCDPMMAAVNLAASSALPPVLLATGAYWGMALNEKNQIFAWGANLDGRLGHSPDTMVDLPKCGFNSIEMCNPTPMLIVQQAGLP